MRAGLLALLVAGVALTAAPAAGDGPRRAQPSADRPVPIVLFHRVGARRFGGQVRALAHAGYRGVTLARVRRAWRGEGGLPARPIVLSFDDGYLSQYRHALPRLRARGWPALLNLELARLGASGGLRRAHVRRMLAAGWELGAHTLTHPDLRRVGAARLREEVAGSRAAIEREFGVVAEAFCYPYGRLDATVEAAVRAAGFGAATTTRPGFASPAGDPYALPRVRGDGRSGAELLRALRRLR